MEAPVVRVVHARQVEVPVDLAVAREVNGAHKEQLVQVVDIQVAQELAALVLLVEAVHIIVVRTKRTLLASNRGMGR